MRPTASLPSLLLAVLTVSGCSQLAVGKPPVATATPAPPRDGGTAAPEGQQSSPARPAPNARAQLVGTDAMFEGLLFTGVQHLEPEALVGELETNGYHTDGPLVPAYGFLLHCGRDWWRAGLVFGGARVAIDDGEHTGSYDQFGVVLQLGWNVWHAVDVSVFPLVGIGMSLLSVDAQTRDPATAPLLRGELPSLPEDFAADSEGLQLELGGGTRVLLPTDPESMGGLAVSLQLVYVLQPVGSDLSAEGALRPGPSSGFGGILLRIGVGVGFERWVRGGASEDATP